MDRISNDVIPGVRAMETSVCLVTEELAGTGSAGGIGAAFFELALLLARCGATVDVLYCPVSPLSNSEKELLRERYRANAIKLHFLDESKYVDGPSTYERKAYSVHAHLRESRRYDVIHFHDYKGLGFFATAAKKQGLAFGDTTLVVQLHGPTRWALEANGAFFVHEDQLKIDHLEKGAISRADYVVSPSRYLIAWLRESGYDLPAEERQLVIKNVCSRLINELRAEGVSSRPPDDGLPQRPTDIVMFGRHEDRKGFAVFCDALDVANDALAKNNVTVSFVGKFGSVHGQPSGVYLAGRSSNWKFACRLRTGLDRSGAANYIASLESPIAVVPSPYENSPYTVLEAAAMGLPLVSSADGGGPELIAEGYPGFCRMDGKVLGRMLVGVASNGLTRPSLADDLGKIEADWIAFHRRVGEAPRAMSVPSLPKVALAITHYERPEKLTDAIISAVRQTYRNLEIIVVDDGSSSEDAVAALQHVETMLNRVGGRLIRRENGYLGAARNTALKSTDADYICFLDDDDYALPTMVETLVRAATATGADVVNCLNVYMPEAVRSEMIGALGGRKPSYIPTGGPLSVAVLQNCLGAATALIKTASLRRVGGYTELVGVGHEDYELFLRMAQDGMQIEIVPEVLYLYEVGRPSMLTRTSLARNFRRCFDALEFERFGAAWGDLVSLSLGSRVAVDARNRQEWLYSQAAHSDLRIAQMNDQLGREERLKGLIALAQADGNTRLAAAFSEDLRSTSATVDVDLNADFVVIGSPSKKPGKAEKNFDPLLMEARLDVSLGRSADAVTALLRYVERTRMLTGGAIDQIFSVVNEVSVRDCGEPLIALSGAIAKSRIQVPAASRARALLVYLELLMGWQSGASHLTDLVESENALYLKENPDVASAVEAGEFKSGAEHYKHFGLLEARKGFAEVTQLCVGLQVKGVELDVLDVLEMAEGREV